MKRECTIFYCGEGIWDSLYWMRRTGSDPHGVRIMMEKDQIFPMYISHMYFAAGNIIKQDLLSLGGDAVVHKFFVNARQEYGRVLLLGTAKHYRLLQTKMYAQHWGLKELAADLKVVMENLLLYRDRQQEAMVIDGSFFLGDISFKEASCAGNLGGTKEYPKANQAGDHFQSDDNDQAADFAPEECVTEWLMSQLPLRRAAKEGFARIEADTLYEKIAAFWPQKVNGSFFYPALSRGYYIDSE